MKKLIFLLLVCGCSKNAPDSMNWQEYFSKERFSTEVFRTTKDWLIIKVNENIKREDVLVKMVSTPDIETLVIRSPGSSRPEILKLYKYKNIIFVFSDISPFPNLVDKILIKKIYKLRKP